MIKRMTVKAEKLGGHYHLKIWVNGGLITNDIVLREDEAWHFLEIIYRGALMTKGYSFYPKFEVVGMSKKEVYAKIDDIRRWDESKS